jgi:hypothetical protein
MEEGSTGAGETLRSLSVSYDAQGNVMTAEWSPPSCRRSRGWAMPQSPAAEAAVPGRCCDRRRRCGRLHRSSGYTVVKGDTLSAIGKKFGVNWRDIASLNQVKNPDLIHPGQVFRIPN